MQGLTPRQQVRFELIQDALKQGVPPDVILVGIPKLVDVIFDENKQAEQEQTGSENSNSCIVSTHINVMHQSAKLQLTGMTILRSLIQKTDLTGEQIEALGYVLGASVFAKKAEG